VKRRLASLALLVAVLSAPCAARAAQLEIPIATPGAPLPADGPAASLLRPATLHAVFRVPPTDGALYVGTPWFVRDLTVTVVGPGSQRRTIVASADLPGAMLGLRLPADAWRADRIELDAIAVSSIDPPVLLSADQLARVGANDWWYAVFFGCFAVLAIAFGALACAARSSLAGWYAAGAAAQALLIVPWLGVIRPPPDASQPLHALLQSCAYVAAACFALRYVHEAPPRAARYAVWALVVVCSGFVWGGDVMQDLWRLPDLAAQLAVVALDVALVALGVLAIVRHVEGARWFVAGTSIVALCALAVVAAPSLLASAPALPLLASAAAALLTGAAATARLRAREVARAFACAGERFDGLTGLPNRTDADERIAAAWNAARRARVPLAALLLDVDHLQAYNACYGHLAGDDVLRRIASAASAAAVRERGFAARYGGEEFAIVLPACDAARAQAFADALRAAVVDLEIAHGGVPSRRLTVSIGVASAVPGSRDDARELVRRAADALYVAKTMGRNRVVAAEPPGTYAPKTESATASFTVYAP
jgi:diguanylate cyclase (GGDEF)-like protein